VDSSDDAILSLDPDGIITSWNPAAERMLRLTSAQAIGQHVSIIIPPGHEGEHEHLRRRVTSGETVRLFETERRRSDGVVVPVTLTLTPIKNADGSVFGVSAVITDLSSRDRIERTARRLAAIVQGSDDVIISKDLDGTVTSWNPAAERLFGYTAAEMIGQSIRNLIPADRHSEEDEVLAKLRRGERVEHFETVRKRKDGSLVPISLTVSPIVNDNGVVVGASKIARDVSDRKRAEEERLQLLRFAEAQAEITRTINEIGTVVSSSLDRDSIVQSVTDAATAATGARFGAFFYNVSDPQSGESLMLYTLSGAPKEAFASFPHPRPTAVFGPTFRGEGVIRIADVTVDPRYGRSAPYHGMPPGHLPVRSFLSVPVMARSGDVLGGLFFGHPEAGVFTVEDEQLVTGIATWASAALENARLYVAAQEANRLKDEFLATLSHELRTPLNAILGYARMIRERIVTGDKHDRAVGTIERNARSLAQIVDDVLDVSRIVTGKIHLNMRRIDLRQLLRDAVDAVQPTADAKGVRLQCDFDDGDGDAEISGDATRLQQVLWNVLSNGIKFTPTGGEVRIDLEARPSDAEIVVRDTGIGIAHDFLPRVFEPFAQAESGPTRERGGLGLGLAIARHLVELHGGRIEAVSAGVGQGATFRVSLPLAGTRRETASSMTPTPSRQTA
jgi:PAS domain S-box-containing protein